jgi:serine/threonine-protein kinase
MFTGRVPFHGDTPVATLLLHLEGTPSFEGPEAGAIPPPLVPVLRKALAKTADERYASAAELAAALRAVRDETLGTQGRSERSPTRVLPRPRSRAVPAGLAGLGVMAVAVAVFLWQREPAATATPAPPPSLAARPSLPSPTSFPQAASPAESAPSSLASERVTLKPAARASPQPVVDPTTPAAVPPPRVEATPTPPTPEPAAPTPSAPPAAQVAAASPPPEAGGGLRIVVEPWAEVSVDGHPMGQTPLNRLALAAGRHDVLLTNPAYEPVQRKVTIRPGETLRLYVDLETDGVRRRR